jgi:hypothetical protein
MIKGSVVSLLVLVVAVAAAGARGRDELVRFDGGIGVIPVSSGAGTPNTDGTLASVRLNVVRGISPGGAPWRIADLKADIDIYGRVKVRGRGLLLAAGNSIGQTANQRVFVTLICEAAAPFVERSSATAGILLEPNGDFRIDDQLTPAPADCQSPVLLVRSSGNGAWFAAAVPKLDDDD